MRYSIDASSLITPWNRHYPFATFPSVWSNLSDAIESKIVVAQELAYREVCEKDDKLKCWVGQQPNLMIPFDSRIFEIAKGILADFPQNVRRKTPYSADAFVIALAIQFDLKVITEEEKTAEKFAPIPYICKQIGVKHIKFIDFIQEMGWSF